MKKHRKLWIFLGIILTLLIGIGIGFCVYVNDYYHATDYARDQTVSSGDVSVYKEQSYYVFEPDSYDTGIIFYPGGKVEAVAYAPLLKLLAEAGYLTILCEMPLNLAVLKEDAASGIQEVFSARHWYLAGHSLGGAMAATYLSKHIDEYDGLILLAAYSTSDLSQTNLNVLSIYGDKDEVLNHQKYEESKSNLPKNYKEYVISGGCHAFFGSYGLQAGDGSPTITAEEQWTKTVSIIKENLGKSEVVYYTESIAEISNPDCGFYTPVYMKCSPSETSVISSSYLKYNALLHLRIDISAFSSKVNHQADLDLTPVMLEGLNREFAKMDAASVSVIVRFAYDQGFNGNKDSEPSLEQMKRHIAALQPLFYAYESMITAVEFGLIGPWGEMHSSTIANQETYNSLIPIYLESTPASMKVLLRRPKFIYSYYGYTLDTLKNFSIKQNRLGVYNDGYLGSSTDLGTYDNRELEVEWLSKLNTELPYGGEVTVPNSSFNQLNQAVAEMYKLKLSYLNSLWNDQVIKRWKDTPYTGDDEKYSQSSEYTYIKNHLGYRLVLQKAIFTPNMDSLSIKLDLSNVGFGNLIKRKNAYILFKSENKTYSFEYKNVDIFNLNLEINTEILEAGEYDIYFILADSLDDQAKRSIVLANEGVWDDEMKGNLIHSRYKI